MEQLEEKEQVSHEEIERYLLNRSRLYCAEHGHNFHRLDYTYARDAAGVAFTGGEFRKAKKFQMVFCARCTAPGEVQVTPLLEDRRQRSSIPMAKKAVAGVRET